MKDRTAEFLEFCRSKPAGELYHASSPGMCALGQFGVIADWYGSGESQGIPQSVYSAAVFEPPFTFGALADRLSR